MKLTGFLGLLLAAASAVDAQKMATYVEPISGVTFKVATPEAAAAPFDLLLSIEATINSTWVGVAMGGCMLRSPILVAWPNKNGVMVSPRWANAYHPPTMYSGTTLTILPTSFANATHWTANVLCAGCSKWEGYAIEPRSNNTFGWGVSSRPVESPANISSPIRFHDVGKDHFEVDMTTASSPKADFDALVKRLSG